MAWAVLVVSGVLEAVWATALGRSAGFTRLGPSIVFAVAIVASMAGLAYAMRELPVGTAYAVWVGIGAVGTAALGMLVMGDQGSALKIGALVLIIIGVIGLNLAGAH